MEIVLGIRWTVHFQFFVPDFFFFLQRMLIFLQSVLNFWDIYISTLKNPGTSLGNIRQLIVQNFQGNFLENICSFTGDF